MATIADENPLIEGLERLPVHPTTLVIFGGTGDLAQRKLLPALYNLAHEGQLPERFNLIAFARRDQPHDEYQQMARASIEKHSRTTPNPEVLDGLLENVRYVPGAFDDAPAYQHLEKLAAAFDERAGIVFNRVFYLSTAPQFFPVSSSSSARRRWTSSRAPRFGSSSRSRSAPTSRRPRSSTGSSCASSASPRSSASTTTWARRRSRTCWRSGSPTRSSSRSGTATTSTTSRSPPPRTWASARARGTTTSRGRCAT